jgi:predicted GNAT superfamily acetyltransferase
MWIQPIDLNQIDRLLTLNNAHARELSWLDEARLRRILRHAFAARRIGNIDAFILALDHTADYDGENFLWFKSRYEKFVYVDRIVVAAAARGRGYAKLLYQNLFATASASGHTLIVCEVNADPPNPESDAFHQSLGFEQVGAATLRSGKKTVNYILLNLTNRRNLPLSRRRGKVRA